MLLWMETHVGRVRTGFSWTLPLPAHVTFVPSSVSLPIHFGEEQIELQPTFSQGSIPLL